MKNVVKTTTWLILILFIGMISSTGSVLAQVDTPCQDSCYAELGKRLGDITIETYVVDGEWPIVVTAAGDYSCGAEENYPCLAWPYTYVDGGSPENINKAHILIPHCCDNPIQILSSGTPNGIDNNPQIQECDGSVPAYPNVCSSFEIRLPGLSGADPGTLLFWFTTQLGVDTNMIDISFNGGDAVCYKGIKGPKCTEPGPLVRVEPVTQCYEFTAENQNPDANCENGAYSVWVLETDRLDKCKVSGVWQRYYNDPPPETACVDVRNNENPVDPDPGTAVLGKELSDLLEFVGDSNKEVSAILGVDECDEGWIQALDQYGCNEDVIKLLADYIAANIA